MARRLRDDGLHWLEEPVWPPEDCDGLAAMRRFGIPIAAGENVAGRFGFKSLIDAGAIDIAQPSVTKIGGIGEMLAVIDLCRSQVSRSSRTARISARASSPRCTSSRRSRPKAPGRGAVARHGGEPVP